MVSSNDGYGGVEKVVNNFKLTARGSKRQQKMPVAVDADGGRAEFRLRMPAVDLAKVDLETRKLAFEQRNYEELIKEHAEECVQQAAGRKGNARIDVARLQAKLEFSVVSIQSTMKKSANV